ncbi:MAG: nucleoside-diphosphate kinase [Candidatus Pacebacteria bacterium]|jgi:nucleoside-diphosphate kinase|nr:nucleoside-diphosphate kinase [Candidatus Paceibacterota bacterium]MDD2796830.1 nucleoside-diphosphate kinase [Candidatus Paceibacterota bacterium]MDD3048304.1 nucleoside-diphosphate kinase [Candidatus Paceibacterota bacterium]MDD3509899.1 nucleoside-diphosphate kinase [Candidatus Paceibacterota bacterium]MDD3918858.1 nucleoside-diphosphate kinase [Candidatus Paceibacterota bacterium]
MLTKKERTFVIIKPDGVQRSLVGEIIQRFERAGLKIVGMKIDFADEAKCYEHYKKDNAWFVEKGQITIKSRQENNLPITKPALEYGKDIIRALVKYMTSSPVVFMVLEGNSAVKIVKKLVGGTEPLTSDVGTIRGDFTLDSYDLSNIDERAVRNLIHCSDKVEEAEKEIKLWMDEKDLLNYNLIAHKILYDVNLDGIKE